MKKMFFLLLMVLPGLCSAQTVKETNGYAKEDYLQKSKNQNVLGIVTASGGGLLMLIGGIMSLSELGNGLDFDSSNDNPQKMKTANTLIYTGGGIVLTSIPLFLSSMKNKKRAASLSINTNTQPLLHQKGTIVRRVPALTLTVSL